MTLPCSKLLCSVELLLKCSHHCILGHIASMCTQQGPTRTIEIAQLICNNFAITVLFVLSHSIKYSSNAEIHAFAMLEIQLHGAKAIC